MHYLWVAVASLVYTVGIMLSINVYIQTRLQTLQNGEKAKRWIVPTGRRWLYFSGSALCVLAVGLVLTIACPDLALVTVLKQQCLIALLTYFCYCDLKQHIIPNRMILIGACLRLLFLAAEFLLLRKDFWQILKQMGLGIVTIGVFFFVCTLISKNGFGMGDIKLFMLIAAFQGLTNALSSIFMAFCASFLTAIVLIITKKKTKKDVIPMAPFALGGTVLSMLLLGI